MPPKAFPVPSFVPQVTRGGEHRNVHPGQIVNDAKIQRRSREEMQTRTQEESDLKEAKQKEKKKLTAVAEIEDILRLEDADRANTSNRPSRSLPQFRPQNSKPIRR